MFVPVALGVRVQLILADGVLAAVPLAVPVRVNVAVPLMEPDSVGEAVRVQDGVPDEVSLMEDEEESVLEALGVALAEKLEDPVTVAETDDDSVVVGVCEVVRLPDIDAVAVSLREAVRVTVPVALPELPTLAVTDPVRVADKVRVKEGVTVLVWVVDADGESGAL